MKYWSPTSEPSSQQTSFWQDCHAFTTEFILKTHKISRSHLLLVTKSLYVHNYFRSHKMVIFSRFPSNNYQRLLISPTHQRFFPQKEKISLHQIQFLASNFQTLLQKLVLYSYNCRMIQRTLQIHNLALGSTALSVPTNSSHKFNYKQTISKFGISISYHRLAAAINFAYPSSESFSHKISRCKSPTQNWCSHSQTLPAMIPLSQTCYIDSCSQFHTKKSYSYLW